MKKVLIFSLAYYPHVGGAEVALKEITDRIPDIEFHVLSLRFDGEARTERIGNTFVHRVGSGSSYASKILFVPRAALAARALHRVNSFDAFWAMMSYMVFPIVLLRLVGIHVPYLVSLQEGDPFEHVFSRWFIQPFKPLLRSGFSHAYAVQAISNFLAVWATSAGFNRAVDVIPNGVDTARFMGPRIHHEGTVLITTSRLFHKNAIDDVIRALPSLPGVRFRVLGIGPEEASLRSLAQERGVSDRVEFLGYIDHTQLPAMLHAADIFIRPSRSEGMGNSFIEAMAAGLPVIATQEGGIADFLFDAARNPEVPTTGWAVGKNSPAQIVAAVQEILAYPARTAEVTRTAAAMVTKKYDWDLIARAMHALFDRMFASR